MLGCDQQKLIAEEGYFMQTYHWKVLWKENVEKKGVAEVLWLKIFLFEALFAWITVFNLLHCWGVMVTFIPSLIVSLLTTLIRFFEV